MNQATFAIIVAALAFVQAVPLESPTEDNRIIGGEIVSILNHPYQVAFFFHLSYRCGAIIINPKWTLTAAHCLS